MEVDLAEAKAHLRIGFSSDDEYIISLIEAAEGYVTAIGVAIAAPVPAPIRHAILLLVSHWYNAREAAATEPPRAIAFGVDALLAPHREFTI